MCSLAQSRRMSPAVFLLIVAGSLAALMQLGRIRSNIVDLDATIEGVFVANGPVPSGRLVPHTRPQWSSWVGDDNHRGHLTLGPFKAPRFLGFDLMGYPRIGGSQLYLENVATGTVWDPELENPGDQWKAVVVELPAEFRGADVRLHAVDDAAEWGGWLALTRPVAVPRWTTWWNGVPRILCTFLLTGVVLFVLTTAAAHVVIRSGFTSESTWLPLACAFVAGAGYLVFWLSFAQAWLGTAATWGALASAAWFTLRSGGRAAARALWAGRDWWKPAALMSLVGVAYAAAMYLYPTDVPMSTLAQTRFHDGLPSDNAIPQYFADRLLRGESPKMLSGDWLSSDRPPLQAGWLLTLMRPALAAGAEFDTAAQCAGIWFQLLWVPFLWMALRRAGVSPGLSGLIIAVIAPSGFLFVNSVYTWPKLGAAAFVLGAVVLWFLAQDETVPEWIRFGAGGILAALGWLAHGGIAFGLLALVPAVVGQLRSATVPRWLVAAAGFLLLAVPWFAYQKLYEPPGNRLLKWHIAGQIAIDDRGVLETLAQAYQETPPERLLYARQLHLRVITEGKWRQLLTFDLSKPGERQHAEFFSTFFALGWWNAGFPVLLLALFVPRLRRRLARGPVLRVRAAVGWALATLMVWVLLMFIPGHTVIHQGSYTVLLVLYPALALTLWLAHRLVFAAVALAQLVAFPWVWLVPREPAIPMATTASWLLVFAGFGLAAFAIHSWRIARE